jgi:pimeloyl-ACP methyl ester carboxylesterase
MRGKERRWRPRAMAIGLACVLAGVGAEAAQAAPLQWGECPPEAAGLECALLPVPLDYRDPGGRQIEIAVSRLRATSEERRRGVILLNPGGPGEAGLRMPNRIAPHLPDSVRERYDLIGFDPRGIQRSAPVSCGLTLQPEDVARFIPWPDPPPDGTERNFEFAHMVAEACANGPSGDMLRFFTTANTARDMDRIRIALGEQRISYFGTSYGSYLGAVYASLFDERTDRFVLDSVIHPGRIWRDTFKAWGPAVEIRFPDFTRWAAERDETYGLGDTSAEVRRLYFDLAARLDRDPLDLGNVVLTGILFRHVTRQALYDDAGFANLATIWQLVNENRPAALQQELGGVGTLQFPQPAPDNPIAAPWAVLCDDANWPESPDLYRQEVAQWGALFPVAGGMAANVWPCAFWRNEPIEPPVRITSSGRGKLLVVQGLRDPATPFDGGLAMRLTLGRRARLVTVNNGGHVAAYDDDVNTCANDAASDFYVTGDLPSRDRFCPAEPVAPTPQARRQAEKELLEEVRLLR